MTEKEYKDLVSKMTQKEIDDTYILLTMLNPANKEEEEEDDDRIYRYLEDVGYKLADKGEDNVTINDK